MGASSPKLSPPLFPFYLSVGSEAAVKSQHVFGLCGAGRITWATPAVMGASRDIPSSVWGKEADPRGGTLSGSVQGTMWYQESNLSLVFAKRVL